jgi:hypothetical protein
VRDLKFSHVVAAEVKTIFEKSFLAACENVRGALEQFENSARAPQ